MIYFSICDFSQYSCLENPMDGGTWQAAVHGVAGSQARLNDFTFTFHFHALEKEMATHSSVLAWRIPGTGEPGGCRLWRHTESDMTEVTQRSIAQHSFCPLRSCCCLITKLCPTLCKPVFCSMPGLPGHHQLLEFSQTHVHWIGDAIQPSHLLLLLILLPSILPRISNFFNALSLHIMWSK